MEEKKEINRPIFGFAQIRFFVAAVLLLAAAFKAYQIATAPLPPAVRGSIFTPLLELFNDRYLLMAVVVGEILFALLLIAGLWRQWTWVLSLLCFSAFTLVSLMKGLSGETSCGCFGTLRINPWITTVFDLIIVFSLVGFRERGSFRITFSDSNRKKLIAVLLGWIVLAGPALWAMLSLKQDAHATLGTMFTSSDGRARIVLEPESWIEKELPLFTRFTQQNDHEMLKVGTWHILLVHVDCSKCAQMLSDLKEQQTKGVAIVVIPSDFQNDPPQTSFPTFILDRENDWFITTPYVVTIKDGICISAGENLPAE